MNPILPIEQLLLILISILLLSIYFAWSNTQKASRRIRATIIILRIVAILCISLIAFNPGAWQTTYETELTEWAIMLDRSNSMQTEDTDNHSRWITACKLTSAAQKKASDDLPVKVFPFSGKLENICKETPINLTPNGQATDIAQAGKELLGHYRNGQTRLAGIILISDGRQTGKTTPDDFSALARSMDVKIYTMPLGGAVAVRDLSITVKRKQLVTFTGQKTAIKAYLTNQEMSGIAPAVTLYDENNKVISKQQIQIESGETKQLSFEITPTAAGHSTYRISTPIINKESRTLNNSASVDVSVIDSSINIFAAEGVPYWDSKFLVQLLRKQPHINISSVYRISTDKFFRIDSDNTYVQETGTAIFPDTVNELFNYDIVIIGRGAEYFLTPKRIKLLKSFVRDHGGCIIFSRGKPYNKVIPGLSELEPVSWGKQITTPFSIQPTTAGDNAGLFGNVLPGSKSPIWQNLPELHQANQCLHLKTFTQVLAEGKLKAGNNTQTFPVLITRRFGKGVVILCNADGLWRWDFLADREKTGNLYEILWTQLLQWAVTYSEFLPGRDFSITLDQTTVATDTPVHIRITKRQSRKNLPFPELIIRSHNNIEATRKPGNIQKNMLEWNTVISLRNPGQYSFELAADNKQNGVRAMLEVIPPPSENDNLSSNYDTLKTLADNSGGKIINREEMIKLISTPVKADKNTTGQMIWQPAWNSKWLLLIIFSVLAGEWFLRRRNGLL